MHKNLKQNINDVKNSIELQIKTHGEYLKVFLFQR